LYPGVLPGILERVNEPFKSDEQVARALAQREANARAKSEGRPMPFPSPWDALDPTKVQEGASAAEIEASYKAFCEICPPPKRIEYFL
jgi:hypothetical protein